ncbi:MAG TPA: site-specific integrase [Xanthobacteraceae bacterium]|jgi:site-specific recombinase XerD|nr:site-specific integrase [Xanthobacteraceae bacterium]
MASLMLTPISSQSLEAYSDALDLAADFAKASKSSATQRAYRSDAAIFATWCRVRTLIALPATPDTIAAFLADQAASGAQPSTLNRRLAAIRYAHRAAGHDTPTGDERVRAVLAGIRRTVGAAPKRKKAATSDVVLAMAAPSPNASLRDLRDRAILLLGFAGAFRRSELVALDTADLAETPQGLLVTIRRSKTDQDGQGRTVAIPRGDTACPVAALAAWRAAAGITAGPLFRRVWNRYRQRVGADQLTPRMVATIVQSAATRLGLDAAKFGAHSLRAGFITSAAKRGANLFKICDTSGHKSLEMLRTYVRDAELFDNHAGAGLL